MFRMDVCDAIRISQRNRHIQNKELAKKVGVSIATIGIRKRCPESFRLKEYFKMAKALGWSEEDTWNVLHWICDDK